jgi:hypothetical protein
LKKFKCLKKFFTSQGTQEKKIRCIGCKGTQKHGKENRKIIYENIIKNG